MDGTIDRIFNEMTGNGRTTNDVGDVIEIINVGNLIILNGKALLDLPNRILDISPTGSDVDVSFFSNSNGFI